MQLYYSIWILLSICLNYYHCVTPVLRSIWSRSSCNWGQHGEANMMRHIFLSLVSAHNHYTKEFMWRFLSITDCISDVTDNIYLADKLPLSAHEGDTVLHRQVQSSLYGLLQREIKVKPAERQEKGGSAIILTPPQLSRASHWFVWPLVEFRVEVSLLGGSSPLSGSLLVRQQDEGNIRVRTVLGAGCQGSVGEQRSQSQHVLVEGAPGQKCDGKEVTCVI